MAKFSVGDRVRVPEDTGRAPREWRGVDGEVLDASASTPQGPSLPTRWEPPYVVRFDGREDWVAIKESWLVAAT